MLKEHFTLVEVLLKELYLLGVKYVFLVPGAQIAPFVNVLFQKNKSKIPKPIIAVHELGAGFMAMGYAKSSGKLGVVLSIGGPGSAYMVGAAITAKAEGVPVVFITGDIPTKHAGKGEFQDSGILGTNDIAIFKEALNSSIILNKVTDLNKILGWINTSFKEEKPLHIQIPLDIQNCKIDQSKYEIVNTINSKTESVLERTNKLPKTLPVKTVFLIGKELLNEKKLVKELRHFLQKNSIPFITDFLARGVIPESDKEWVGYLGLENKNKALEVINNTSSLGADIVISIGKNQNITDKLIVHKSVCYSLTINEITKYLACLNFVEKDIDNRKNWLTQINQIKEYNVTKAKIKGKVTYFQIVEALNNLNQEKVIYSLDSGQIRKAVNLFLKPFSVKKVLQSATISPMGFGICSAIGVQCANRNKQVISLFGDGSMKMHGMELITAVRYKLPIIFILCDNESYGSSILLPDKARKLSKINWETFANSIKIKVMKAESNRKFNESLKMGLTLKEPLLIWVKVPELLTDEVEINSYSNNWISQMKSK